MNKLASPLLDRILAHRSIRKFTTTPLSDESIEKIVRAAQMASTSSFIQAYSIVLFRDPEKKRRLAALSGEQRYVEECPAFLLFCADLARIEAICQEAGKPMLEGQTEHFIMATVDTALAAQNALLAAESMGLGGVFIGGVRNHIQEIAELADLPRHVFPVFGLCIGEAAHDPGQRPRLPLRAILMEEKYHPSSDEDLAAYDEAVRHYYVERTRGDRNETWRSQIADTMGRESRPHMLEFLNEQGFLLR